MNRVHHDALLRVLEMLSSAELPLVLDVVRTEAERRLTAAKSSLKQRECDRNAAIAALNNVTKNLKGLLP